MLFNMAELVPWKKKEERYFDNDEELGEAKAPKFIKPPKEVKFIMKDETNAEAMKAMKIKWWKK